MTHPLHLNPPLNLAIPPNLSLTLFVSHLNNSKSVLNKIWTQYVHSTYFWCNYIAVKTKTFQCKSNCLDITYNIQQCCECVQTDSQKFYSQLQSCQLELLGYWKQCRKCCWDLWCVMLCSPMNLLIDIENFTFRRRHHSHTYVPFVSTRSTAWNLLCYIT